MGLREFGRDKTLADQAAVPSVGPDGQKVSLGKRILYTLWDSDGHLKSPEERWFLQKLDMAVLSVACLGWFMKYIDQANLANAYVSGLKEDLNIEGNEYTYMQTCYLVGFAIMQLPAAWFAIKVRPSWFLFGCEFGWMAFTFAQAGAKSSAEMYFFRFMVGLFESAFSPVILFLLGSWYSKPELAKRVALWHMTGFVGQACSGFLQAAIYQNLDGAHGLAGWRWLYIVCGGMTFPVALMCLFCLPDYPSTTKAWFITEEERQMALRRSANAGKKELTGLINVALFKRVLSGWKWWAMVLAYISYGTACQANSYFGIYLKSEGYSVSERNILPACANLLSALLVFSYGFGSDFCRNRYFWMITPLVFLSVPGNAILAVWPSNANARFAAFYLVAGEYVTCVFWTWANEMCNGSAEERAILIASMNCAFYVCNAWLPNIIFQQTMGPTFRRGFPATLGFAVGAIVLITFVQFMYNREVAHRAAVEEVESQTKSVSDSADDEKKVDAGLSSVAVLDVPTLN